MSRPITFREVIDVLLGQGATVLCYRCGKPILTGNDAEREHLVEDEAKKYVLDYGQKK